MRASDVFMSFHLSNSMKENARHVQFNTSRVLARGFKWFRVDGIMAKINTKWLRSMRHVYCNAFNDHSASQKEMSHTDLELEHMHFLYNVSAQKIQ